MSTPADQDIEQQRAQWQNRGYKRPSFADNPAPGQESVWDYPRPPVIEENYRVIEVYSGEVHASGQLIASSQAGFRVLETAGAPTYYLPRDDVEQNLLIRLTSHSFCEWKGQADYWALADSANSQAVAWTYPEPFDAFLPIADCYAFYCALLPCFLDAERVRPQPGGFYGGWVSNDIAGPFKGEPGTQGW